MGLGRVIEGRGWRDGKWVRLGRRKGNGSLPLVGRDPWVDGRGAVVWLAGLPDGIGVMPRCWTRKGLEEYAVAEHDVAYTAFHALQGAVGIGFVEEVVEGHGEAEDGA